MKQIILTTASLLAATMNILADSSLPAPDPVNLATARRILLESPLIDGHNDLPWQFRAHYSNDVNAIDLTKDCSQMKTGSRTLVTDIPRMRAGGMGGQFWSVYIAPQMTNSVGTQAVIEQIDIARQIIGKYPETFELALTADDVERIFKSGKIASLIGMEGGMSIDNSLATLRMTYLLGARYMTLTHTKNLDWADAATDKPLHHGLTEFGRDVVREMNRLGMLVDISHVTAETMVDTLKTSKAPVIFSHSNARALCDHERNAPDDVLGMLAKNGGVIMVNFYPEYLTEAVRTNYSRNKVERNRLKKIHPHDSALVEKEMDKFEAAHPPAKNATYLDVADHIDHIRKIAGIDNIGIGADYEGFGGPPDGLKDVSCYPVLFAELLHRGYSEEDIKKIAGLNVLRALRGAEQVAAEMKKNGATPKAAAPRDGSED